MPGWIALHGGGEFQRGSEIGDRRLIVAAGGADARVIVVPTAAGIDYPEVAARNGIEWFRKLGARADAALAVDATSANDPNVVAKIETATMIYLPGGDPVFLVNALRGSKAWAAILAAHDRGVILGGASAGAMAFGAKMWNPHTGGLIDGLNLVPIVTLPHFQAASVNRAKELRPQLDRATRLFGLAERTSAIWNGSVWTCWGPGEVVEFAVDGARTYQSGESFA
ncbi:MAG TPA: Type 1 glutamine amidotransferase-like domain-containing protein [Anaerolineae bacterium]|nr:Type 1 glutamine amidotransferase-like domain-containing protein [Anaerolineae bacterium]